jgi:hypothetical protein
VEFEPTAPMYVPKTARLYDCAAAVHLQRFAPRLAQSQVYRHTESLFRYIYIYIYILLQTRTGERTHVYKTSGCKYEGKAHLRDPIINGGIVNQNRSERNWV